MKKFTITVVIWVFILGSFSCTDENKSALTDAQQLAALKNVDFSYKEMDLSFQFPEGALNGQTLADLIKLDSSKYASPANYGISFSLMMNADNTGSSASDAKFDGMLIDIIMDTISSSPVELLADAFEIKKNETKDVNALGEINLKTHRLTGLYIFQQAVDGNDIETTLSPEIFYKIGLIDGSFPIPDLHQNIPTRASDETKAFLRDLLNSGIFNEQ